MGKAISTLIEQVDNAKEKKEQQLQTLQMLREMAITKHQLWLSKMDQNVGTRKKFYADVLISQEY